MLYQRTPPPPSSLTHIHLTITSLADGSRQLSLYLFDCYHTCLLSGGSMHPSSNLRKFKGCNLLLIHLAPGHCLDICSFFASCGHIFFSFRICVFVEVYFLLCCAISSKSSEPSGWNFTVSEEKYI